MKRIVLVSATILLLLPACAIAQEKPPSLGELARRNQSKEKQKSARTLTNEDMPERAEVIEYPTLGVRFAMPLGWESPKLARSFVRAACPGHETGAHDPSAVEKDACSLAVAVDGLPARRYGNARLSLENTREQMLRKALREVGPWREFSTGNYPAGEHVVDYGSAENFRRMRLIYIADAPRNMLVIVALIAKPELFDAQASAPDYLLGTLEFFDRKR